MKTVSHVANKPADHWFDISTVMYIRLLWCRKMKTCKPAPQCRNQCTLGTKPIIDHVGEKPKCLFSTKFETSELLKFTRSWDLTTWYRCLSRTNVTIWRRTKTSFILSRKVPNHGESSRKASTAKERLQRAHLWSEERVGLSSQYMPLEK